MIHLLFVLSGAAAVIYQVVWQRVFALAVGAGAYSTAIVVASFLAGLGLGQWLGGITSVRTSARGALRAFAAVEAAVALVAAATCPFYSTWVQAAAASPLAGWAQIARDFAVLLVPTTLMGFSLPLLVRAVAGPVDQLQRRVTALYAANAVGAALGAVSAPWLLIRYWGLVGAVGAAASLNAVVAVGALALAAEARGDDARRASPVLQPRTAVGWLALAGLSGFSALSLEMIAFRVVEVSLKASAFTFGSVLALYLGGLAVGSALASWPSRPLRRPLRAFLACQAAASLYTGLALLALAAMPMPGPLAWYPEYWARYGRFELGAGFDLVTTLRLYVALPLALFGPPTILLGMAFRALQAAIHDDARLSGLRVGRVMAANTVGCIAGTLLIGLVAFEHLGTAGAARLVVGTGVIFALVGLRDRPARAAFGLLAALVSVVAATIPDGTRLWAKLHGAAAGDALVEEDASGVAAIVRQADGTHVLFTSGCGQSTFPYGGIHTVLGAVPVALHSRPRHVAVVGLGSGDTAWAAGSRLDTKRVDVLELVVAQGALLRRMAGRDRDVAALLADPRLELIWVDGRQHLLRSAGAYDVIEIDALEPTSVGSGNVNSVEFFGIVASRLAPGGLVCAWVPTARARAALRAVFPYGLEFRGYDTGFVVGSLSPVLEDLPAWRRRASEMSARLGAERLRGVLETLETARPLPPLVAGSPVNRDLFPADEFQTPYPSSR